MLLSSSNSDMIGDLWERDRQFSRAREMDGGAEGGGRRLWRLAVREVGVTGGRVVVQSEGMGEPSGKCRLGERPEPRWM